MRKLRLKQLNNLVAKMEFKVNHSGFRVYVPKDGTKMTVLLFHLQSSDSFPRLIG